MSPEKRMRLMQQIVPLVTLHRRFGLAAFLIIIIISVTGILLNHTEELTLKDRYIESGWIMSWYGIEVEGEASFYQLDMNDTNVSVASLEDHLYVNNQLITQNAGLIIGAVAIEELIIVSTQVDIYLITLQAELIEKMSLTPHITTNIEKIGLAPSGAVLLSSNDGIFTSYDDYLSWQRLETQPESILWSDSTVGTKQELEQLKSTHMSKSIDWERLVLDLHSGRIFGQWGVWLYDLAALIIIFLCISGCWTWYKKQQLKKLK